MGNCIPSQMDMNALVHSPSDASRMSQSITENQIDEQTVSRLYKLAPAAGNIQELHRNTALCNHFDFDKKIVVDKRPSGDGSSFGIGRGSDCVNDGKTFSPPSESYHRFTKEMGVVCNVDKPSYGMERQHVRNLFCQYRSPELRQQSPQDESGFCTSTSCMTPDSIFEFNNKQCVDDSAQNGGCDSSFCIIAHKNSKQTHHLNQSKTKHGGMYPVADSSNRLNYCDQLIDNHGRSKHHRIAHCGGNMTQLHDKCDVHIKSNATKHSEESNALFDEGSLKPELKFHQCDIGDSGGESWNINKPITENSCLSNGIPCMRSKPSKLLSGSPSYPIENEAWYNVNRHEAERMLISNDHTCGTYMLRPSSDPSYKLALSVKYFDCNKHSWLIKHYRISLNSAENKFYIFRCSSFNAIAKLVTHYKLSADGLICRLTDAYPRPRISTISLTHLEAKRSSFKFIHPLGRGSFGEVWLALWNQRIPVAIKTLLPNGNMDTKRFLDEARLMQLMQHPRIVHLLAVCTTPASKPAFIVTELMDRGSLKSYMRGLDPETVHFSKLLHMIIWVAEGMAYLEERHFVHRDLRSSNVLVDCNFELKVADFGLSHLLNDSDEYVGTMQTKFPIRWTALEGILNQTYSTKSDVWSFGVFMYEVLTFCEIPYQGLKSKEVREHVCRGNRLPNPSLKVPVPLKMFDETELNIKASEYSEEVVYTCPKTIHNMMLRCWDSQPAMRPTFVELLHWSEELLKNLRNMCT